MATDAGVKLIGAMALHAVCVSKAGVRCGALQHLYMRTAIRPEQYAAGL